MTHEPGRLVCPLPRCRAVNSATAETCRACATPLRAWARLRAHPANLFNAGLQAARSGRTATARDHFAAVVHWCPGDAEARSALALTCLLLDDPEEARHHWGQVLTRRPNDATAVKGLAHLDSRTPEPTPATGVTVTESPEPPQTSESGQTEPAATE
ncbi:tetratricopeptide repeat protein [Streptomyces sp. NPDC048527]|uniref:tetratricopeptide repeat protein n=1 Tax=Streptomyces sp. NPDC048527 TaxID=3365568 RepID=UPI003717B372